MNIFIFTAVQMQLCISTRAYMQIVFVNIYICEIYKGYLCK